jgi:uncharacterized protein (DUF924 family)
MMEPTPARDFIGFVEVLAFWREAGPASWFKKDLAFDAIVSNRFLGAHEAAANGALDGWLDAPESALALILLLDQFPRNMFRDTPRAFATDERARHAAYVAIARNFDARFENPIRRFFYLPMMHSESLTDQDFCIARCRAAGDGEGARFGEMHRDIIARFGRFPHRNAIYGRQNSAEEQAFLDLGGFAG